MAVAVDSEVDEWRVGVEALAQHDHRLAVRIAVGQECGRGGDREVAGDLAPDVVELIGPAPDVCPGAGDLVLPGGGVELRGSLQRRSAHIVGTSKNAEASRLTERCRRDQADQQHSTHAGIVSERMMTSNDPVDLHGQLSNPSPM